MAYADFTAYKNSIANSTQRIQTGIQTTSASVGSLVGYPFDGYYSAIPSADTPTTAVVPGNTLAAWQPFVNGTTGRLVVNSIDTQGWTPGTYMLCDRLSHQGGLSGTLTTAQTTNLPTAALTRYTTGEGVIAMVSVIQQLGASTTTYTLSYTNQAGTSGKTSVAARIGGAAADRSTLRTFFTPLAAGDTGVRSVESFTLAATTGTTSQVGISLIKPLLMIQVDNQYITDTANLLNNSMHGGLPEILDDAFLFWVFIGATTTMTASGSVNLTEV